MKCEVKRVFAKTNFVQITFAFFREHETEISNAMLYNLEILFHYFFCHLVEENILSRLGLLLSVVIREIKFAGEHRGQPTIFKNGSQRRFHQGVVTFGRGFKESAGISLTVSRS